MIFVVVLILLTSTNLISADGIDDDNEKQKYLDSLPPQCSENCKKATFFKLPEGVKDQFELKEKMDAGKPEGSLVGENHVIALDQVQLCGEELNKLGGNKACPENTILWCYRLEEGDISLIHTDRCFLNKTKCVPEPNNKQWERTCQ